MTPPPGAGRTGSPGPLRAGRQVRPVLLSVPLLALLLTSCTVSGADRETSPPAPGTDEAAAGEPSPQDSAPVTTSPTVAPGEVVVLVAASFTDVVTELAERFEDRHPGVAVTVVPGPSSGLAQQVLAGSPGDVFVSAAPAPVEQLVESGEVLDGPSVVALNSPVLAVPEGNPGGVTGLADLADDELVVSLCEPQVPCGAVAAELLAAGGVQAAPDTLERDVRAVLTRLTLGEADAGIVYATDARAAGDEVEVVEVPGSEEVTTTYPAVVLAGTSDPDRARAFVDLLRGPVGASALGQAGFRLP